MDSSHCVTCCRRLLVGLDAAAAPCCCPFKIQNTNITGWQNIPQVKRIFSNVGSIVEPAHHPAACILSGRGDTNRDSLKQHHLSLPGPWCSELNTCSLSEFSSLNINIIVPLLSFSLGLSLMLALAHICVFS